MGLTGIEQVKDFHKKFGLPIGEADVLTGSEEAKRFRIGFLQEELDEFKQAIQDGDNVKAFDALLDLAYIVYGTALFMGITPTMWDHGFSAVQKANMSKVRATQQGDSKRGTTLDVVKPEGWQGPEETLAEILVCRR